MTALLNPPVAATFAALVAFLVCLAITPICSRLAWRKGIVDHPDLVRKLHRRAVPRMGGVPLVIAASLAIASLAFLTPGPLRSGDAVELIPAVLIIFAVGLIDDRRTLPARAKLGGQIVAALVACSGGLAITQVGGVLLHPAFGWTLTVFWLVACTNAANLIDGADGLAGSIVLTTAITICVAFPVHHSLPLLLSAAAIGGAVIAFLIFNWEPASIFLGDSGSLTLGFIVGSMLLLWSRETTSPARQLIPTLAFAVPLLDVGLSASRRYLSAKPVLGADTGHLHHRILRRGFSNAQVSILLASFNLLCGLLALVLSANLAAGIGATVVVLMAMLSALPLLGYHEFALFGRALSEHVLRNQLRRKVGMQLMLADHRKRIQSSQTPEECWTELQTVCTRMECSPYWLNIAGHHFESPGFQLDHTMTVELAISDLCKVGFSSRGFASPARADEAQQLVILAQFLRQVLPERASRFARARTTTLSTRAAAAGARGAVASTRRGTR